ncbi:MFS transporter [Paenibacillus sediminis]|uniref:EmrB/QacA subfamily drug resistance transporter n=1 Tax=Paenibacillus sediminis TaxID=664909 RepID=A0ABS4H3E2_9BACL|nr:MFS transporter [Paenibacillus sediminis]MBP1937040.1 EmrB/QacA subfamily drug resistance transporter [Paenibacillus sediminis]
MIQSDMTQPETNHSRNRTKWLVITVGLGTMLNPLNSSMISVALSRLQEQFGLSFTDATWLISTYYLASAIGQPVMGKLSDIWGRRRLYIIGLLLITISSVLAPFSPNFGWLIAFRIIQAVGSSTLFPSGMGMIRKEITEGQAQALGVLSIFTSTSAAFGPSIGGFLIHFGDWPAIFMINFPFILGSFLLALRVFPKDAPHQNTEKIDWLGVLLFSVSIMGWLLFLLSLEKHVNTVYLSLSVILTLLFYFYEKRKSDPFIDVTALAKNINLSLVYVQFILINVVFYSIFFGVPTYLQHVQHFDSGLTGLVMLAVAGFGVVVAPLAGRWIDRSGSTPALLAGAMTLIAGTLLMLTIQDHSKSSYIFAVLSVLGISNGFNNLAMQTALYSFTKPEETGAASGLFMTSRYLGTIFSSSLLGIVFAHQISTAHFHIVAIAGVIIGCCILLLSIRMPRNGGTRSL